MMLAEYSDHPSLRRSDLSINFLSYATFALL